MFVFYMLKVSFLCSFLVYECYSDKTLLGNWYESRLTPNVEYNNKNGSKNCLLPDVEKPQFDTTSRTNFNIPKTETLNYNNIPAKLVSKFNVIDILRERKSFGDENEQNMKVLQEKNKNSKMYHSSSHSAYGGPHSDKAEAVSYASVLNSKTPQDKNTNVTFTNNQAKKRQQDLESVARTIASNDAYNPLLDEKSRGKTIVPQKKSGFRVFSDDM